MASTASDHFDVDEAAFMLLRAGISKAYQPLEYMLVRNFLGGALTSVGGMITLIVKGGCDGLNETNPGIVMLLGGLVFPVGLAMSTLTGGELSTGNVLFLSIALLQRKIPFWRAIYVFFVSFFANLAGSLFYLIIAHFGHILSDEPYKKGTITFANDKVLEVTGITIFVRAIGCNWLICIGVFCAFMSRTVISRVVSIWIPIFVFVAVGFENSVANMFLVPIGMINGAPVSVGLFIWKSLILSTLGNIVGGGVFVALVYWFIFVYPKNDGVEDLDIREGRGPILPVLEKRRTGQTHTSSDPITQIESAASALEPVQSINHVRRPSTAAGRDRLSLNPIQSLTLSLRERATRHSLAPVTTQPLDEVVADAAPTAATTPDSSSSSASASSSTSSAASASSAIAEKID
ncbi:Formate/nitrite transporter-domain-containing protein [Limtongia smithiae]|uniref:Formate/nitrite transporter-domain-containing protein n=1 Tax=Limtongia smithiae TaxID=1125753 RepID=UPI0034CDBBCC